jgi:hypothetical protein
MEGVLNLIYVNPKRVVLLLILTKWYSKHPLMTIIMGNEEHIQCRQKKASV